MPRSDLKMPQSQLLSFCRLLLLNKHSHHDFVSSKQVLVNSRSLFLTSSPISSAWCQIGLSPFSVIYHSGASYSSQHQEGDAVWSCFANYLVLPPLSTGSRVWALWLCLLGFAAALASIRAQQLVFSVNTRLPTTFTVPHLSFRAPDPHYLLRKKKKNNLN